MTLVPASLAPHVDAFWSGLKTPSIVSVVGALALCAIEFALCVVLLTPKNLAKVSPGYFMTNEGDEYARLALHLIQYRLTPPEGLQIAYMGGSTATRSILTRDPNFLSRVLTRRVGREVRFNIFSTNSQRYEDELVITDQFPKNYRGAVVIVINDWKDDEQPLERFREKHPTAEFIDRLPAIDSPSRDDLWRERGHEPGWTGVFFLDHLEFFAARRIVALRFGTPPHSPAPDPVSALDPHRVSKARERVAQLNPHGSHRMRAPPILANDRPLVEKLIDNMQARGIMTILVEAPVNPLRGVPLAARIDRYTYEIAKFASLKSVAYWNFNKDLVLTPEDFQDSIHLGSTQGRRQFQTLLVDSLVKALQTEFGTDNGADDSKEDSDG